RLRRYVERLAGPGQAVRFVRPLIVGEDGSVGTGVVERARRRIRIARRGFTCAGSVLAERSVVETDTRPADGRAQVQVRPMRIGDRPVAFEPPLIRTLHVDQRPWLGIDAVLDPLEPPVQ